MESVRRAAIDVFRTRQAAEAWLTARSRHLGKSPLACAREGHADLVLAMLRLVARNEAPDPRFSPRPRALRARLGRLLAALRAWGLERWSAVSASAPGTAPSRRSSPPARR